jgi:hypothetical protein
MRHLPWRYDAAAAQAIRLDKLRQAANLRYVLLPAKFLGSDRKYFVLRADG